MLLTGVFCKSYVLTLAAIMVIILAYAENNDNQYVYKYRLFISMSVCLGLCLGNGIKFGICEDNQGEKRSGYFNSFWIYSFIMQLSYFDGLIVKKVILSVLYLR